MTPAKPVSNGRFNLMKVVLSNGDRRVQILFWGTQIDQFSNLLQLRAVIKLDCILCKVTSQNFWREENNLIPFELHVQGHTLVTRLGMLPENQAARPLPAATIATFQSLARVADGTVIGKLFSKFIFRSI